MKRSHAAPARHDLEIGAPQQDRGPLDLERRIFDRSLRGGLPDPEPFEPPHLRPVGPFRRERCHDDESAVPRGRSIAGEDRWLGRAEFRPFHVAVTPVLRRVLRPKWSENGELVGVHSSDHHRYGTLRVAARQHSGPVSAKSAPAWPCLAFEGSSRIAPKRPPLLYRPGGGK